MDVKLDVEEIAQMDVEEPALMGAVGIVRMVVGPVVPDLVD